MSQKFGEKLRKARTERNKTLEELAAAIGSSKAYVWQLENKKSAKPSAELLLKIANCLSISPDFLLNDDSSEYNEKHLEDAFFRRFQKLSEDDKRTLERIASGFNEKSDDKS